MHVCTSANLNKMVRVKYRRLLKMFELQKELLRTLHYIIVYDVNINI